ncbi:YkoF family thiamine/hydroxymethylpyrimidine-binding protein [Marinobacterium arenosum]|uniref:YkoF family thiamine/hydroxymethylpyrimidine-binding protein n=1 Tax=Marinobacterium arenosum TaxID=2862496 RepID=UPI001C956473|nr:YkoF family thiamine/hydroxymethylpyrimidine-binding protein [Marinobacterium arenosum]MBY4677401.1 hypothetical protein [Marinobacterium arenosum]
MKLSVEISLYPLADDFIPPIEEVIQAFHQYDDIQVVTNSMSTQLYGDYERVMEILDVEMRRSFARHGRAVFVAKFIAGDVRELA